MVGPDTKVLVYNTLHVQQLWKVSCAYEVTVFSEYVGPFSGAAEFLNDLSGIRDRPA